MCTYCMHFFLEDLEEMEDYVPLFFQLFWERMEGPSTAPGSRILTRKYKFNSRYYLWVLKYILKLANIKNVLIIVPGEFMVAFDHSFCWNYVWSWLPDMHLPNLDVVKDTKFFLEKQWVVLQRKLYTKVELRKSTRERSEREKMRRNLKKGKGESRGSSGDIKNAMQPSCQPSLTAELEHNFCLSFFIDVPNSSAFVYWVGYIKM